MKVIDVLWFSPILGSMIGIVAGEDEITGERKAYIGVGDGADEKTDMQHILVTGAPFTLQSAKSLLEILENKEKGGE